MKKNPNSPKSAWARSSDNFAPEIIKFKTLNSGMTNVNELFVDKSHK